MWPTKRQLDKVLPIPVGNSVSRRRVVETVEAMGLDPTKTKLAGSAAIHMYGIELPLIYDPIKNLQPTHRPNDVDLAVTAIYWDELHDAKKTPSGLPLKYSPPVNQKAPLAMHKLQFDAGSYPNLFSADILTDFKGGTREDAIEYDVQLKEIHEKHSHIIPGTNIRVLSLGRIATMLGRRFPDPKAKGDLREIKSAYRHNRLPGKKRVFKPKDLL